MARCNCSGQVCACRIQAGENVTVTGSGSTTDPLVISASGGGSGGTGTDLPPGVWFPYGGTAAPAGYLMCNGQAVNRSTFAALFAVIGTRFGAGDGATTFNVPNLTNRVPVGAGGLYSAGSSGGSNSITLTVANLPPHQHGMAHTHDMSHDHANPSSGGGHTHNLMTANDTSGVSDAQLQRAGTSGHGKSDNAVESNGAHTHDIPKWTGGSDRGSSQTNTAQNSVGQAQLLGQSFTNMPPYVATNWIIKT